jgi:hypothetical protein
MPFGEHKFPQRCLLEVFVFIAYLAIAKSLFVPCPSRTTCAMSASVMQFFMIVLTDV